MSPEQSKIENDDEHNLATEEGEEAHLEDVVPHADEETEGERAEEGDEMPYVYVGAVQLEKAQKRSRITGSR